MVNDLSSSAGGAQQSRSNYRTRKYISGTFTQHGHKQSNDWPPPTVASVNHRVRTFQTDALPSPVGLWGHHQSNCKKYNDALFVGLHLLPGARLASARLNGRGILSTRHPTVVTSHRNTTISNEAIVAVLSRVGCNWVCHLFVTRSPPEGPSAVVTMMVIAQMH